MSDALSQEYRNGDVISDEQMKEWEENDAAFFAKSRADRSARRHKLWMSSVKDDAVLLLKFFMGACAILGLSFLFL